MVTEPNGAAVAVDCRVSHIENGQLRAASVAKEPVVLKTSFTVEFDSHGATASRLRAAWRSSGSTVIISVDDTPWDCAGTKIIVETRR
jgi:hypothetical protein